MRAASSTFSTFLSRPLSSWGQLILNALFVALVSASLCAQITVSTPTLAFTVKQVVGTTSPSKPVVVTNTGGATQNVVIATSGDYTESDNCGGSIPSGGSCTINASFAPTVASAVNGAVTIRDGSSNLLAFVTATGSGLAPVTVAPGSLAFGNVPIGTLSAAKTFKITNNAVSPVNVTAITYSADYVVGTGTCLTTALNHGQTCTVTVQVQPTSPSTTGTILITDNAPSGIPIAVKLTTTGTGSTNAPVSLSKSALIFKAVTGGISAAQTITVTNTSGSAVALSTIAASGQYAVVSNNCPASLPAGANCSFGTTFNPTFVGATTGTVAVSYTGNNSPQLVNLTGTAIDNLTVAPASLVFTSQAVGTTSPAKPVKITNNSASSITLNSVIASGDYQIFPTGTTCPLSGGTLLAGKFCTLEVQFAPTRAGAIVGSVTVTDASSPNPLLISLTGTATSAAATVTTMPTSAHQGSTETIVITGNGTHFSSATTASFGANITLGTITVNGSTQASVSITIDPSAVAGSRAITFTTGSEMATGTFVVMPGVSQVTLINPNTVPLTTTSYPVAVTGAFTSWVNGTTKANFGPGVSVGGAPAGTFGPVTVNSATGLTATLKTASATSGFRTVQIQTGAQTLTVQNGVLVETCTATPPTVVQISPINGGTNVPLNSQVQVQFSVPMNRSTFSLGITGSIRFYDSTGTDILGTIAVDASGTIATITPSVLLPAGRGFTVYLSYSTSVQDTCGNNLGAAAYSFTTAFNPSTTGPTLTGSSPVGSDTNTPLNAPVSVRFDKPIDPVTAQSGFSLQTGGNAVAGNFAYSADDRTVTFTPVNPLTASATYTVGYGAQITDTTGNPLTNPGSFTFTAGTSTDTTPPQVALVDPASNTIGVGLNVNPRITFTKPVNGLTVLSALALYYENGSLIIPEVVTVSADRLSATITPNAPLQPDTTYGVYICGYSDIAGNNGYCSDTLFTTGTTTDTGHATVVSITPANAQTAVPVNAQVVAVISDDIDPTSITNTSINVTQGATQIPGTVSLASDGVTLTFVPNATLAASTVYNVSVGGFRDTEGNTVSTFTSTFTTGSSAYGNGSFTVLSTNPVNGATNVPVNMAVTFTMSNLINAASVNSATVLVYVTSSGNYVAGTFAVTGAAVKFTPVTNYPGNTNLTMYLNGMLDEAGNSISGSAGAFTTANTVDTTPPTVTITPANGATKIGLNTQIVLAFSKSIDPSTITTNTLALFNGDTALGYNYTVSRDNRTIVINSNNGQLPSGATITIELTNGIHDLSGNALANTTSQFTLTQQLSQSAPSVLAMRPGNGATGVPANTVITLFTSAPMDASTIVGAFHITDNGTVVSGTVQTFSNAQAIEFTPAAPFNAGDLVQVYLDATARDLAGNPLNAFSGQFTIAGSLANTAATAQVVTPFVSATNVPLNAVIQVEYNQALLASTVNNTNVTLYQYSTGTYLTPTVTLIGAQVISIVPPANLLSGSQYQVYVSANGLVTNTSGLPVQAFAYNFTAGTAADSVAPTIVAQAPTDTSTNIGTNSQAAVTFNKAMNPVSVTGSTIQLSAGSTIEVPSSIAFTPDYTRVIIVPQAPLPASTSITFAINGVQSQAGLTVAKTTHFTTATQPDFSAPSVVESSVLSGQTNVPVNSVFSMTFSKPMDVGSFDPNNVNLYANGNVPATISWSADLTTIFIVPTSPLSVGTNYILESYYMTDLSGNPQINFAIGFTAAFVANNNPPTVVNTNPEDTETQVPVNAPVQILFSEPIQPTSIGKITLVTGGNPVTLNPTLSRGNQLLTLTPSLPLLAANASYSLAITGVKDTAGNVMTGTVTHSFTTGPSFDLLTPAVLVADPASGMVGVGTNVAPRLVFSKRINPISLTSSSIQLYNYYSGQLIPVTLTPSSDRMSVVLTPTTTLMPGTEYQLYANGSYTDVAGNAGQGFSSIFTTGTTTDTGHATVVSITPANAQTAVPVNAQVVAVISDDIDPTSITNTSINVTQGATQIPGTVSLASDGVTLTFVPNATLAASTVYNVSVGGFRDTEGNTVSTFTSTFTTGSSAYGNGSFTVLSTNPVNGATNVPVNMAVTFTMSNLINAASVNSATVLVYVTSSGNYVAGTFAVTGAAVKFTPVTNYPGNTNLTMYLNGMLDEAGNSISGSAGAFTTANTVDTTPPTVTITPVNGTTNVGLNSQIVFTFSKSINPTTIASSTVNLLNGDVPINPAISISRDNRTVVLNYNSGLLPANATITATASRLITDLSGNALADTTSKFTTAQQGTTTTPSVISMRPGNGTTDVPVSSVITLFTSAQMNVGTLPGALHVSQNGLLISGTANVGSNGQSLEFTPSSNLTPSVPVQVFLDSTAQDIYGNSLNYFAGQFTPAGALSNTASVAQAVTPFVSATNVPLNAVIQVEYDQPLLASTVNGTNVTLYQYSTSTYLTPTVTLIGTQVISIVPPANLLSGSQYQVYISPNSLVTNTSGFAVQPYAYNFTAGTAADSAAPTISSVAPPNNATNIGTNAGVSVSFNKAINPVSVNGANVHLTAGSTVEVPSSISFTPDFTRTIIIPQAPLPPSTLMTLAISGVTSQGGVAAASQTTHFTTLSGPDFNAPYVVHTSVDPSEIVGTNAAFAIQFSKPMDPGSYNPTNVYVYDNTLGTYAAVTVSFSTDLTTIMLKPTANLAASDFFSLCAYYMTDLSGNPQQNYCVNFYAGTGHDTTGPMVKQSSPPSTSTSVPTNAIVSILFTKQIAGTSIAGVTLMQSTTVVPTTAILYDGDQGVQLTPLTPLLPSTAYTINVAGVTDITGNIQTAFTSTSFTTGTGTDLVAPTFVSSTPVSGATNVPVTTTVKIVFSKAMDPGWFDANNSFTLYDPSNVVVPANVSFSADLKTVTLTPKANLTAASTYFMYFGYFSALYDLSGNQLPGSFIQFTTH